MKLTQQEFFDKIESLLLSIDDVNINLAITLAQGYSMPIKKLPVASAYLWLKRDYAHLFEYINHQNWVDRIKWLLGIRRLRINPQVPIHPSIKYLRGIEELIINDSDWETLPEFIFTLPNLKSLHLKRNRFQYFPDIVANCKLETLELVNHRWEQLPKNIEKFKSIHNLNINMNDLTELPTSLFTIKNLVSLSAKNNKISRLSPDICQCKTLETLYLQSNQLSDLPHTFEELKQLKHLVLRQNCFSHLPKILQALPSLTDLELDYNQIEEIKEIVCLLQLKQLNLNDNKLKSFPKAILQFNSLEHLNLSDNQIEELSQEKIIDKIPSQLHINLKRNNLKNITPTDNIII